ncbi:MAG TPA: 3'-5' exonuclease [Roseiarcus sp.]|nr:3'-5' exonuclease [Roseiarcus sp.]
MLPRWIKRPFQLAMLKEPAYRFLFEPGPPDEAVSIDCETTGLNPRKDDIVTIAAIKIRGARILTSESFEATLRPEARMRPDAIKIHRLREADVANGRAMRDVIPDFLRFIGGRPLVGYYLDFDVAMLNRHVRRFLGVELPNQRIETSALYYERKYGDAPPGTQVDLRFASLLNDLKLPVLDQHDAYSDALMTAMAYVALRDLKERDVRIERQRSKGVQHFEAG